MNCNISKKRLDFPFQVLKVHAKKRIGEDNFITSLRKIFEKEYNDKFIGKYEETYLSFQGIIKLNKFEDNWRYFKKY